MSDGSRFVLDADSFIRAKREHYAFDFCPGFWDALLHGFNENRVGSIVSIRREILRGKDALADWVKDEIPQKFFEAVDTDPIQLTYAEVLQWVQDQTGYSTAEKQRFVSGADPWLVAFAKVNNREIVTYEVSAPESKAIIKLPDVARQLDVKCIPPYVMLRRLQIKLALS
jgi:hypothetical protein